MSSRINPITTNEEIAQETIDYCKNLVEYSYTHPELVNTDDIKTHKKHVKKMRSRDMSYSESTLSILLASNMGSINPSYDLKKIVKGSKSFKAANCFEYSFLGLNYLRKKNVNRAEVLSIHNGDHVVLCLDREGDINNPETWGDSCLIIDVLNSTYFQGHDVYKHLKNYIFNRFKYKNTSENPHELFDFTKNDSLDIFLSIDNKVDYSENQSKLNKYKSLIKMISDIIKKNDNVTQDLTKKIDNLLFETLTNEELSTKSSFEMDRYIEKRLKSVLKLVDEIEPASERKKVLSHIHIHNFHLLSNNQFSYNNIENYFDTLIRYDDSIVNLMESVSTDYNHIPEAQIFKNYFTNQNKLELLLEKALAYRNDKVIKYLLQNGAGSSNSPNVICNLFDLAIKKNNGDLLKFLCNQYSNYLNTPLFKDGDTLLHYAAQHGKPETIEILLDNGANYQATNNYGKLPIHSSVFTQNKQNLKYFLSNKPTQSFYNNALQNTDGWSALHIAACKGYITIIEELIGHGADINSINHDNLLPIDEGLYNSRTDAVKLLLKLFSNKEKIAWLNKINSRGDSPLGVALCQGNMVLARILIDNGANLKESIINQYNKGNNLNWKSILNSIPNAYKLLNETYPNQNNLTIAEQTMGQALYSLNPNLFDEIYHALQQTGFILDDKTINKISMNYANPQQAVADFKQRVDAIESKKIIINELQKGNNTNWQAVFNLIPKAQGLLSQNYPRQYTYQNRPFNLTIAEQILSSAMNNGNFNNAYHKLHNTGFILNNAMIQKISNSYKIPQKAEEDLRKNLEMTDPKQTIINELQRGNNTNWQAVFNSISKANGFLNETYPNQNNLTIAEQTMGQALYSLNPNLFDEIYHALQQTGFILDDKTINKISMNHANPQQAVADFKQRVDAIESKKTVINELQRGNNTNWQAVFNLIPKAQGLLSQNYPRQYTYQNRPFNLTIAEQILSSAMNNGNFNNAYHKLRNIGFILNNAMIQKISSSYKLPQKAEEDLRKNLEMTDPKQTIINELQRGNNTNWQAVFNSISKANGFLNETYPNQNNLTIAEQTMGQALYSLNPNPFDEIYHALQQTGFILDDKTINKISMNYANPQQAVADFKQRVDAIESKKTVINELQRGNNTNWQAVFNLIPKAQGLLSQNYPRQYTYQNRPFNLTIAEQILSSAMNNGDFNNAYHKLRNIGFELNNATIQKISRAYVNPQQAEADIILLFNEANVGNLDSTNKEGFSEENEVFAEENEYNILDTTIHRLKELIDPDSGLRTYIDGKVSEDQNYFLSTTVLPALELCEIALNGLYEEGNHKLCLEYVNKLEKSLDLLPSENDWKEYFNDEKLYFIEKVNIFKSDLKKIIDQEKAIIDNQNTQIESLKNKSASVDSTLSQPHNRNPVSSCQDQFARQQLKTTILNSKSNESWKGFLKTCIDMVELIPPETKFIRLPMHERTEKARKIADFNSEDPAAMKYAVACVLKAISTPRISNKQFGQTSAMEKFLEKFNSNEITGEVRNIIYDIVGQNDKSRQLTIKHFSDQKNTITQLSDYAIENGFDLSNMSYRDNK